MDTNLIDPEESPRVDIRAQALINNAFRHVIHTGAYEQVVVMTLPPDGEIGEAVRADSDQLFVLVEGVAEARVGAYVLGMQPGDLVFVAAGTRHNIVNRATTPLRLITVCAPPPYAPGTTQRTKEEAQLPSR